MHRQSYSTFTDYSTTFIAGIGVLVALLLAVSVGWIVSCVILLRRGQTVQTTVSVTCTKHTPHVYPYHTLPRLRPPPLLSESSCIGKFASRIHPPGSDAFVSEQLSRKGLAVSCVSCMVSSPICKYKRQLKDNLLWIAVEDSDSDKERLSDAESRLVYFSLYLATLPSYYIDVYSLYFKSWQAADACRLSFFVSGRNFEAKQRRN